MFKLDLHTHSTASPDGGISAEQYAQVLEDGLLDFIAVTDHNSIDHAVHLHELLGEAIIVGEEITAHEGELIGLFLTEAIPPGLTALETAQAIRSQGGLVYLPHPFETVRKGLSPTIVDQIIELVDVIEVFNGRAVFQNKGPQATTVARINGKPGAAASDAHGVKGLGTAFSTIKQSPTAANLVNQLTVAHLTMHRPPLQTLLYPKAHRLKKRFGR